MTKQVKQVKKTKYKRNNEERIYFKYWYIPKDKNYKIYNALYYHSIYSTIDTCIQLIIMYDIMHREYCKKHAKNKFYKWLRKEDTVFCKHMRYLIRTYIIECLCIYNNFKKQRMYLENSYNKSCTKYKLLLNKYKYKH